MTRRTFFAFVTACLAAFGWRRRPTKSDRDRMLDEAEARLLKCIRAADNAAILFYLKAQKGRRGYES